MFTQNYRKIRNYIKIQKLHNICSNLDKKFKIGLLYMEIVLK